MDMGGLKGVVSGLIANGNSLPTVDLKPLLDSINSAGEYQKTIINNMPEQVRQMLAQYASSLGEGASKYQTAIQGLTQSLQDKSAAVYGPNTEAANAQKVADKNDVYSTVPGTQNAIRNALAATGGLSRGHAATSLAQPYMQAAQQYGQQAGQVNADQTKLAQGATMQALQTATSMDAAMFQQMFGMTKEQAAQILQTGNKALQDQLAQLINQSNNQTNQTLSVQGIAANNAYQNAVTRNGQQNAIYSGLANMGIDGLSSYGMPGAGEVAGAPSTASAYSDVGALG